MSTEPSNSTTTVPTEVPTVAASSQATSAASPTDAVAPAAREALHTETDVRIERTPTDSVLKAPEPSAAASSVAPLEKSSTAAAEEKPAAVSAGAVLTRIKQLCERAAADWGHFLFPDDAERPASKAVWTPIPWKSDVELLSEQEYIYALVHNKEPKAYIVGDELTCRHHGNEWTGWLLWITHVKGAHTYYCYVIIDKAIYRFPFVEHSLELRGTRLSHNELMAKARGMKKNDTLPAESKYALPLLVSLLHHYLLGSAKHSKEKHEDVEVVEESRKKRVQRKSKDSAESTALKEFKAHEAVLEQREVALEQREKEVEQRVDILEKVVGVQQDKAHAKSKARKKSSKEVRFGDLFHMLTLL